MRYLSRVVNGKFTGCVPRDVAGIIPLMEYEANAGLVARIERRLDALQLNAEAASKKANLGRDFIRNIKRGKSKSPGGEQMKALADVLECSIGYLLDIDERDAAQPAPRSMIVDQISKDLVAIGGQEFALLPVYDLRLSAGPGAWASDDSEPLFHEPYRHQWLRSITAAAPSMLIVARVEGDSMENTLHSGDQVLIDRSRKRANRDGIYGFRLDDELMVKRIAVDPQTRLLSIISDNSQYPRWDGVRPDSIDIIGRVIWLGRQV